MLIGWILFAVGLLGDIGAMIVLPKKTTLLTSMEIRSMPEEGTQELRHVKRRESLAHFAMMGFTIILIIGIVLASLQK